MMLKSCKSCNIDGIMLKFSKESYIDEDQKHYMYLKMLLKLDDKEKYLSSINKELLEKAGVNPKKIEEEILLHGSPDLIIKYTEIKAKQEFNNKHFNNIL